MQINQDEAIAGRMKQLVGLAQGANRVESLLSFTGFDPTTFRLPTQNPSHYFVYTPPLSNNNKHYFCEDLKVYPPLIYKGRNISLYKQNPCQPLGSSDSAQKWPEHLCPSLCQAHTQLWRPCPPGPRVSETEGGWKQIITHNHTGGKVPSRQSLGHFRVSGL